MKQGSRKEEEGKGENEDAVVRCNCDENETRRGREKDLSSLLLESRVNSFLAAFLLVPPLVN